MNAKEILEKNGFDFEVFEIENEHSAKNLISAMNEYAIGCCKIQRAICYEEAETHPPYSSIVKGTILNAPLPEILNDTK